MEHQKTIEVIRKSRIKKILQRKRQSVYEPMMRDIWADFCGFTTLHGAKNMFHDFCYLNKASTKAILSDKYIWYTLVFATPRSHWYPP